MAWKKLYTDKDGKCDILIVRHEGKNYAVAAPACEAVIDYLVEFRVADTMTLIGKVVHQVTCKQFDDTWTALSMFTRLHDVVKIYSVSWSEEDHT